MKTIKEECLAGGYSIFLLKIRFSLLKAPRPFDSCWARVGRSADIPQTRESGTMICMSRWGGRTSSLACSVLFTFNCACPEGLERPADAYRIPRACSAPLMQPPRSLCIAGLGRPPRTWLTLASLPQGDCWPLRCQSGTLDSPSTHQIFKLRSGKKILKSFQKIRINFSYTRNFVKRLSFHLAETCLLATSRKGA